MWFEFNGNTQKIQHYGWHVNQSNGVLTLRNPDSADDASVSKARDAEYLQIVEFHEPSKKIRFARDYLGFCPLLYAIINKSIFISDDINKIIAWLKMNNIKLTLSDKAIALYFTMGFVPQGLSIFNAVKTCENAAEYDFYNGCLKKTDTFSPIDSDSSFELATLKSEIIAQTAKLTQDADDINVWCSGGLDSTSVAYCAKLTGKPVSLISFDYPNNISKEIDSGELPYLEQVSRFYDLPTHKAKLDINTYKLEYQNYIKTLSTPIFDVCVPIKFYLGKLTKGIALTGEGGDLLFAGSKKNMILYMLERYPKMDLGHLYALASRRYYQDLHKILTNSSELKPFVSDYLNRMLNKYQGSLEKKLYYMNAFVKQGSLIFTQNYYAAKSSNITIKHPLTALNVYKMAFMLPEEQRYVYPKAKLALINMFKANVPSSIVRRKKTGTIVPLHLYLSTSKVVINEALLDSPFINSDFILKTMDKNKTIDEMDYLAYYAILCLNDYINHHMT